MSMKVRLVLAMCVVVLLLPGGVAGAEVGGAAPVRPEGFSPKVSRDWRLIGPARVAEEGGRPIMAASRFSAGVLDAGALKDFTIAFRYRHANGIADIVLGPKGLGRPGPVYHVMLRSDAVVLARETRRGAEEPKTVPHAFQPGSWYDISIQRGGGRFVVAVGGQPLLAAEDTEGEPVDLAAFGSLAGEGFAFADVTLRGGPAGPVALTPGRPIFGLADDECLRGWRPGAGARFERHGDRRRLDLGAGGEGDWTRATAADYTLVFRCLGGKALVCLQRSGQPPATQEYRLRLDGGRVALSRVARGSEREMGSAPVRVSAQRWHEVAVLSSGGWKHIEVDHREVLKLQDPEPLPAGSQTFCSMGGTKVAYADAHLTPWRVAQALAAHRAIEENAAKAPQTPAAAPPSKAATDAQVVPLKTTVYQYVYNGPPQFTRRAARLNPGPIPPHFVHTWILDVKDIEKFRLHFDSAAAANLDKDDRITVYNLDGLKKKPIQHLASFLASAKTEDTTVDLKGAPLDDLPLGPGYRRLYLQLETSAAYVPRRFLLTGLLSEGPKKGTEEALLFGDDLNYDDTYIAEGVDELGGPFPIPAPWASAAPTNPYPLERPLPDDGWYLVARHFTLPKPKFYALVYYNEHSGKLRLYLYNMDMAMNVSGTAVTLSLLRFTAGQGDGGAFDAAARLKGAIFPLHTSPNRWSSVTVPVVRWTYQTWACIDIPVLYPMAENIPVDPAKASPQPATHYRSLYEEPLQPGFRGIRVQLQVNTYDFGTFDGTLAGSAIGKAIQDLCPMDQLGVVDFVKAAAKSGGEIFSAAKGAYTEVKKQYGDMKKDPNASGIQVLGTTIAMGSSVFSGAFAIVGAALSFIQNVTGADARVPIQLSIDLDLQGSIKGTFNVAHTQGPQTLFYLPGRFPIQELRERLLPLDDPRVVASLAPRYDRTLGLFGYKYHPGQLAFNVYCDSPAAQKPYEFAAYPVAPQSDLAEIDLACKSLEFSKNPHAWLDRFLPIIYNPFAEIVPVKPILLKTAVSTWWEGYPMFMGAAPGRRDPMLNYDCTFDQAWKTHVIPEPDDTEFPIWPKAWITPTFEVRVYHATPACNLQPVDQADGIEPGMKYEIDAKGLLIQIEPDAKYMPSTYTAFQEVTHLYMAHSYMLMLYGVDKDMPQTFPADSPFPLENVIYRWDLPYFHYARSRRNAKGGVPRPQHAETISLRAPVSIRFRKLGWDAGQQKNVAQEQLAKSALLRQQEE